MEQPIVPLTCNLNLSNSTTLSTSICGRAPISSLAYSSSSLKAIALSSTAHAATKLPQLLVGTLQASTTSTRPMAKSLLCDPNPNSPANSEAARMFSENKRYYNSRVREIVEQSWR